MQAAVDRQVAMPAGYALSWSGQFEYLERATQRLQLVVPATLTAPLADSFPRNGKYADQSIASLRAAGVSMGCFFG